MVTNDIELKTSYLHACIQTVRSISIALAEQDEDLARIYGRGLFIGVDSFLKFSAELKNKLGLPRNKKKALKKLINRLRNDYQNYYSTIRHKLSAHQQQVELALLVTVWSDIDKATLSVLADDVESIWNTIASSLPPSIKLYPLPTELTDRTWEHTCRKANISSPSGVRVELDRVAMARDNTVSIVPSAGGQEKMTRIMMCIRSLSELYHRLNPVVSGWVLPQDILISLVVVDLCSLIDNIYLDNPGDDSLLTIWTRDDIEGESLLRSFVRDATFEAQLREVRNKYAAHLDRLLPLTDIFLIASSLDMNLAFEYLENLSSMVLNACRVDMRTKIFLMHGQKIEGVSSIETTSRPSFF